MNQPLRVGLIGLDTSHVPAFTELLNDPTHPHHLPAARVVAGFPGGVDDFEVSRDRVASFTETVRDKFGVDILDSPQAVAEAVDLLLITSVDGRAHRRFAEQTVAFGKPTFIDKPFTTALADAEAILRLYEAHDTPVMSCSALRYADPLQAALKDQTAGPLLGIDVFGPMGLQPLQPGLFWYGVHAIDMVVAAMGTGCTQVQAYTHDDVDLITMTWPDGRAASYRGSRRGHRAFGATLHREAGFQQVDLSRLDRPYYASLLAAILKTLPHGISDITPDLMLESVKIMEAANQARAQAGQPVTIAHTCAGVTAGT